MSAVAVDIKQPPLTARRGSRLSISELGGSSSSEAAKSYLAELYDQDKTSVTSRLSILASPKSSKLELPQETSPQRPPVRRGSSFRLSAPLGASAGEPATAAGRRSPATPSQAHSPLPNQPTRLYNEDEVYEEIRKFEQDSLFSDFGSSAADAGVSTAGDQHGNGVVEISDDILLPFAERSEVKDILLNSQHKAICDLLRSDQPRWSKILKVLDIPRDVMNDQAWIAELKSIIYPKGESLWHRVVMAIGIDANDAAVTPTQEPAMFMWVEPVHDGDSLIECDRANEHRRQQDSTTPTTSTSALASPNLPFALELPGSPRAPMPSPRLSTGRRHERTASGGSLRSGGAFRSPMDSIAEDIGASGGGGAGSGVPSGFPEPTQPPRKLNFELLAEQERQMAQNSFAMPPSWQRRGGQLPNLASSVPPSLDPEECEGSALDKAGGNSLRRSRSGRSGTGGAESPTDRPMRGLRFVLSPTGEEFASNGPHSPSASLRRDPLSKSHSSVSDGCAVETESDDDHPYFHSLSHSSSVGKSISRRGGHSKLRFGSGPALLA